MIQWMLVILCLFTSPAWAERFTFTKGATSQTVQFSVWDSSSTIGGKLTGVVYNAAGLTCYYTRAAGTTTAITLATQTATGAYSAGGWVQSDATNAPGRYRLDVPDAVLATGVDRAAIDCKGATNMVPVSIDIELVAYNPQDSVRAGLTALPNAAAGANGGIPLGDASGDVTLAAATHTGAVIPTVTTLTNLPAITSGWLTAAGIAAGALNGKGDWNIGKTGYELTVADKLAILTQASGIADSGSTTTIVDAERTEADTDYWAGQCLLPTSGNIAGQVRRISAFNATTDTITVDTAWTQAASTNTYIILRTALCPATSAIVNLDTATGTLAASQFEDDFITAAKIAPSAITSSEAPNLDAPMSSRQPLSVVP